MKILISNDGPHALYYFRLGLARALSYCGHEVTIWEIGKKPVYDAFDEAQPDLFFGQTYNLTDSMVDCINTNGIKTVLRAADYGNSIDRSLYPVLYATDREIRLVNQLKEYPFLHIHHHEDWMEETHGNWEKCYSIMNAADVFDYTNGNFNEKYKCDIAFVGGYWPYKSVTFNSWMLPLCHPLMNYNIRIFGNQNWPTNKYCGFIDTKYVKDILKSASICPNLSEPHSQIFGYDVVERPFKLLSNKCFCISDYVEGLYRLFPNSIVYARNPSEFKDMIDHYLKYPEEKENFIESGYSECINNHTYFHRIAKIFDILGIPHNILDKFEELKGKINL